MRKIGNILFLYIFVFIMCMGASFAWYAWKGSEVSVNVNFANLDPYIKYSSTKVNGGTITPSKDYTGGISNDITFNKEESGNNLEVYGHIYLKVTSAKSDNVFKASNLKWTLVSVSNNKETEISTGNFVGESVVSDNDTSKMIPANINFNLTKESDNITYKVYVWVDENKPMNVDIGSQDISVETYAEANSIEGDSSKLSELYVRSIEYSEGVITSIGSYSSKYNINGYMIVNSNTIPSAKDSGWNSISGSKSSSEDGYLYTIKPNKAMDDINNICIRNENNEVYCKYIGKYSDEAGDKPTSSLCKSDLTYNGELQQLVSSTSGVGYTLSSYKQINANLPNEKGYKITAKLNDGYVWKDGTSDNVFFYCKIAQKDLIVKALDQTINYGETISQGLNKVTSTGLVEKDSIASITLTPSTTEVTDSGTITAVVSAILNNDGDDTMGNYNIMYEKGKLVIRALSIENATITLNPTSYTYDGNEKKPTVSVLLNNKTLVLNTDYTVSYSNNKNAGTATVTVTGKGNYTGSKSINFTINYKTYTITLDNQSATSAGTTALYGRYADGIYLDSSYSKKMTTSANNITVPTKTGYTFGGYYTEVSGGGTQLISDSGYITSSFTNKLYNNNVTLYAKWSPNTYTVSFNSNGGTGTMSDLAMTYGTAKTLTANSFKKQYTVTYNYDGATGGNSQSSASANYKFVGWTKDGINLYSKLNLNNNSFTIDDDGMYYVSKSNTNTSNSYLNFWYNMRNDIVSGNDYTEVDVIKTLEYSGSYNFHVGDTHDTVKTQITYGVKDISNMKVGNNYFALKGSTNSSPSLLSRGFITLPANASITIKFRPVLIAAKYNNIDMYFFDSSSVKNLTATNGGKVNLYADWNETSITLPTPTKTGYTFAGWYTASSGGTKVGNGGSTYIPTSNVTLYARWNVNTYTLTVTKNTGVNTIYYKVNGASSWTSTTSSTSVSGVKYGTAVTYYYTVDTGYKADKTCTSSSPCTLSSNVTGNLTLSPTATLNKYTITLDNQSATDIGTSELYGVYKDGIYLDSGYSRKMTTSTNNITVPKKTGYTFGGYYTEVSGGGTQLISDSGYITSSFTNTLYNSDVTLYAKWTANSYIVTFNSGNFITGLDDVSTTSADRMKYSVSNKVVTVTANSDDGYGFINARVYLDANTTYVFSCNTDGIWGSGGDTVEAFLMLDGEYNTYYHMDNNNNFEFTPTVGGSYWLRLDVNTSGKTYTFSNIAISKNITTKNVTYGEIYGDLSTIDRTGYTFLGWYDSDESGSKIVSSSKVATNSNHTLYAHWKANEYTINYNFNDTSNMSYWNYLYQDRFIINSYDESSKLTDISVYGEGGWEIVYIPFTTIAGKKYTMSFDYQVPSSYSALSGYSGVGYQILNKVPDNNDNSSNSIFTGNLPTSAVTTTKTITLSFTATGVTTYLAFNFGMSADNATTRVKLGNIKLSTNVTYSEDSTITFPTLSFNGYSFSGWSTNSKTKSVINDSNEYSGSTPSGASYYSDFKEYRLDAPFYSGDVYRLEVDARGSGTLYNYFYGDSGYLQVARVVNSDGYDNSNIDGSNTINLTSGYKHYTITFTLGSSGDGNVAKRLLFRTMAGSSASVKNVKFYKLNSNESIYLSSANLNNLIVNNTTNFYGMGHINSYTLTVNPNGGTYSSSTSNRSITQNFGTLYGLSTPSKSGSTFSGWSVSGSGSLIRGNASGEGSANGITKSVKTDTDGSQYTNYTVNYTNSGSGYYYPNIGFGNYSYTSGHTYRLSVMVRVRSLSGFGYFMLRHGAFNNDWGSNFMKAVYFSSDLISNGWVEYTIDNTFTGTAATMNGNSYTINPAIEIYGAIASGSTGVLDMDIKNLRIYDITADTYVTDNSYGGYIYKFGNDDGSVTANYNQTVFSVILNNQSASSAGTTKVYYQYNTTKTINGVLCYYYTDSALTNCLSSGYNITTPTKTGYTFGGYYTDTNGSGTQYVNSDGTFINNVYQTTGDRTLYAYWIANNYYLDLNGYLDGSSSGNISGYGTADVYVNGSLVCNDCTDYYTQWPYGSTYEIKDIKATTGHSYNGVYSGSASGTITGITSVSLKFTTNTYYIYFNANGGSGVPGTQSYTYSSGGTVTLSSTTPSRSGYNFLGWSTSSSAGSPSYYAGSGFPKSTASNTTLYAVWGLPTGINAYRGTTAGYYESGTKDFLYITTCDNSNTGYCNFTAKNADATSGSIVRGNLTSAVTDDAVIAKPVGTTGCNSTSCTVYVFTQSGLTDKTASPNQVVGVLNAHRISSTYPVYKTSTVSGNYRKIYFSYNTGANIITSFTLSYYAYGAGTIQKISYQGDWYFGWTLKNYVV